MPVYQLTDKLLFPPPSLAGPDGLLAVGGDLSPKRLLLAYRQGIFPWFMEDDPILWWFPSPRLVIFPEEFRKSRRLTRLLRQGKFRITMDCAFDEVIRACAGTGERKEKGTWITPAMMVAYCRLHEMGFAHSVECWRQGALAGGLYGVALGGTFFGESMFSRTRDGSKVALAILADQLAAWDFDLIDCQMPTQHLLQFGARELPRRKFQKILAASTRRPTRCGRWKMDITGQ